MNFSQCKALGIAGALLLLGLAACTDPTVAPKTSVTGANFFLDPASYQEFLAKIYAGLALSGQAGPAGQPDISGIDEGFSQYLRLYWEAEELPTDEAVIAWNDPGLPFMNTQTWDATNPFVVAMYYRIFFQVGLANEFLRETTPDKLTARGVGPELKAQIQQYRAEARFLRALSYWHGIDLFGSIPLVTENDPIGATAPKQSTRVDIYNYVVSELNAIKADLPAPGAATYGRATGPAADMLLAELYLNDSVYTGTADWSHALTEAQAVIAASYTLDPSYAHLFQADNHTSGEIIFAIPQDGVRTQTYGGVTFLVHASVGGSMSAGNYGINGGWYGLRLKPEAYNSFAAGDGRAASFWTSGQSVIVDTIPAFDRGIPNAKFTNKTSGGANGSDPTFVDTDFPMFRLGEAYLIYAEAVLRGGGGTRGQALTYVNALRERAYGGTSGDITDPQLTLDFIRAERGRELLWEGHRRTDLVRFGLFTGGTYLWAWKGQDPHGFDPTGKPTAATLNLYPLPANELIANPNLHQNPGY
ncbi:MAG TPA: RagB/SusD family nutrient uptake outer membrane protein, partial [Gemmatimonadales bacterium]|nr:RagB/SusD family nutrient uptake outer membrane protein [Gemmatimonadales bacterium]